MTTADVARVAAFCALDCLAALDCLVTDRARTIERYRVDCLAALDCLVTDRVRAIERYWIIVSLNSGVSDPQSSPTLVTKKDKN
jgi:flavin reductase (DIM6/NTAB) family NADH-FMN oxidoreductase RutF